MGSGFILLEVRRPVAVRVTGSSLVGIDAAVVVRIQPVIRFPTVGQAVAVVVVSVVAQGEDLFRRLIRPVAQGLGRKAQDGVALTTGRCDSSRLPLARIQATLPAAALVDEDPVRVGHDDA